MKVNRTSFFANKNMRLAGNTSNRPEQLLARDLIQAHYPEKLETEYTPKDLHPLSDMDLTGNRAPRLDIAIPSKRIAIRINGPSHTRKNRRNYDRAQQVFLESQDKPWTVIDIPISGDRNPVLYRSHERGLSAQELRMAYEEIRKELDGIIHLPRKPKREVIDQLCQKN